MQARDFQHGKITFIFFKKIIYLFFQDFGKELQVGMHLAKGRETNQVILYEPAVKHSPTCHMQKSFLKMKMSYFQDGRGKV